MNEYQNQMDFQDAIRKIEERGDWNRFAEVKPIFEARLEQLSPEDHTERGLCYYYLLVSYLKAHLVHETHECIEFYEKMDEAFVQQENIYSRDQKDFSWSEISDYFRLMERCYGSLEFLYHKHDFKERLLASHRQKMRFRMESYFFNREYWHFFEYKFLQVTSFYGTSLVRWAMTTFVFTLFMSFAFWLTDQFIDEAMRTIGSDGSLFDYFYYSMITITTVGYGDITPVHLAARILAVTESFLGFLMLGIFIGLIHKRL